MSRDLTCNETMSVIDEAETKDSRRYYPTQGTMSSRVPIPSNVPTQISRPVLKTLRGQSSTHLMNSGQGAAQKTHLLNSLVNASSQPSTSQLNRSSTSKVVSGRPSSAMSPHSMFKPLIHQTAETSAVLSDDLAQAVIYQQLQQQQSRLNATQQQSAFSFPRSRDYERIYSNTSPVTGLVDARFYNPAALSRLRPVGSRSTTPQQMLSSVAAINHTLRLTPQPSRNIMGIVENAEISRPASNRHVSLSNSNSGHDNETNVSLSSRDSQAPSFLVGLTPPTAICNPSTSSANSVFTNSNSSSSQINNSHGSPHPGPSPRPSILRKIRDPNLGNSSAVRRLAFGTAVSRPNSCSETLNFSSGLNEDSTSFLTKYLLNSSGKPLGVTSASDNVSRVLSSNDSNVRNLQVPVGDNVALSRSAFEKVGTSPQHSSDSDTPRKRMRKQQFDSFQAPEKIKMEVSVQLDSNKVGVQTEEIPLWKLAPPGQPASSATLSKNNEKGTKRRGRPRTESRVDLAGVPSTSNTDGDKGSNEGTKPKKSRRHQVHSTGSEHVLSENVNPVASAVNDKNVSRNFNSEVLQNRDAIDAQNAAVNLRNLMQTLQNGNYEVFQSFVGQPTMTPILQPDSYSEDDVRMTKTSDELKPSWRGLNLLGQSEVLRLEALKEPLSLDDPENSSDLSPVETGYASPTILASIEVDAKQSSSSQNLIFVSDVSNSAVSRRLSMHLNNLNATRNIRFNHFDRIESVKQASQKIRLLKAAKNKFTEHHKLNNAQKLKERVKLKRLLNKPRRFKRADILATDCAFHEKLSDLNSVGLQKSTVMFFDELDKIVGERLKDSLCHEASPNVSEEPALENNFSKTPNSASEIISASSRQQDFSSIPSCSKDVSLINIKKWDVESAAIAEFLDELVDRVAASLEALEGREIHGLHAISSSTVTPGSDVKTNNNNNKFFIKEMNHNVKQESNGLIDENRSKNYFLSDEEWDSFIAKEIENVGRALRLLKEENNESEETELRNSRLGFKRLITTFDALRRAKLNENENVDEILHLFFEFLRALDYDTYEKLNEDFEMLYDIDDDDATRERKRLGLIQAFAVQIPRARTTLKKSAPYVASSSTNFRPSCALIEDLFEMRRLPREKSWSKERQPFFVNRRLEIGKTRTACGRFSGEFNIEAELEGTEPGYLPFVFKGLYERHIGCLASRLRLDSREEHRVEEVPSSHRCKNTPLDCLEETPCKLSKKQNEIQGLKLNNASVVNGDSVTQQNFLNEMNSELRLIDKEKSLLVTLNNATLPASFLGTGSACISNARKNRLLNDSLNEADCTRIRNRMRNIREQFATLLQTSRTNAVLANSAFEVFNNYSEDLLVDFLHTARTDSEGSDAISEHSTNEEVGESVETLASVSQPPSP